jgi:hypothetical protein
MLVETPFQGEGALDSQQAERLSGAGDIGVVPVTAVQEGSELGGQLLFGLVAPLLVQRKGALQLGAALAAASGKYQSLNQRQPARSIASPSGVVAGGTRRRRARSVSSPS